MYELSAVRLFHKPYMGEMLLKKPKKYFIIQNSFFKLCPPNNFRCHFMAMLG